MMTIGNRPTSRRRWIIALACILVALAFVWVGTHLDGQERTTSDLPPCEYARSDLYKLTEGFVPDSSTALKIAEAAWLPIYGETIYDEKPYQAKLLGDSVWVVCGTLPEQYTLGGVAYMEIRRSNGEILGVIHGE